MTAAGTHSSFRKGSERRENLKAAVSREDNLLERADKAGYYSSWVMELWLWLSSEQTTADKAKCSQAELLPSLQPAMSAARPCTARLGMGLGSPWTVTMTKPSPAPRAPGLHSQTQHHGGHHVRRSCWHRKGTSWRPGCFRYTAPVGERGEFSSLPDKTFGMISVLG